MLSITSSSDLLSASSVMKLNRRFTAKRSVLITQSAMRKLSWLRRKSEPSKSLTRLEWLLWVSSQRATLSTITMWSTRCLCSLMKRKLPARARSPMPWSKRWPEKIKSPSWESKFVKTHLSDSALSCPKTRNSMSRQACKRHQVSSLSFYPMLTISETWMGLWKPPGFKRQRSVKLNQLLSTLFGLKRKMQLSFSSRIWLLISILVTLRIQPFKSFTLVSKHWHLTKTNPSPSKISSSQTTMRCKGSNPYSISSKTPSLMVMTLMPR